MSNQALASNRSMDNLSQSEPSFNTADKVGEQINSVDLDLMVRDIYLDNELDSMGKELIIASNEDTQITSNSNKTVSVEQNNLAELAKKSANPMSSLWMLWLQNDTTHLRGDLLTKSPVADGHKTFNSTKFQPVMSFPLKFDSGDYNLIVRPVIQYQSVPLKKEAGKLFGVSPAGIQSDAKLSNLASDPWGRTNGFGDTALLTLLGPDRADGFVWGAGITQIFPTAEEDVLGQEKWQAGPALLVANFAPKPGGWNVGALAQHWSSYAGDDDRADTSLTNIQYFLNYRLSETELLGMSPNITYNWKADSDNALTLPVGLGYSNVIRIGKLPIRLAAEMQYNVVRPENVGGDWNFRLMIIPIVPRLF